MVTCPTKNAGKSGFINVKDVTGDWLAGKVKVDQSGKSVAIWS